MVTKGPNENISALESHQLSDKKPSNPEYISVQENNETEVSEVKAEIREELDLLYSKTSLNKI